MSDLLLALDASVEAMATGPEHGALVALCRSLASSMDVSAGVWCSECERGGWDERLWREYRLALDQLMKAVEFDGRSDLDEKLDEFLSRAPLDDSEDPGS